MNTDKKSLEPGFLKGNVSSLEGDAEPSEPQEKGMGLWKQTS